MFPSFANRAYPSHVSQLDEVTQALLQASLPWTLRENPSRWASVCVCVAVWLWLWLWLWLDWGPKQGLGSLPVLQVEAFVQVQLGSS